MATDLHVEGPYELPFDTNGNGKRIGRPEARQFWADKATNHLLLKQGCYVFAMRVGKGFKPWYVGRAGKGFGQEVLTDHKRDHYNDVLFKKPRGTPVMFFVTPPARKRAVPAGELNHMEKELIQFALKKNPGLKNVQNTKNTPKWTIKGVVRAGRGRRGTTEQKFKTMMGM